VVLLLFSSLFCSPPDTISHTKQKSVHQSDTVPIQNQTSSISITSNKQSSLNPQSIIKTVEITFNENPICPLPDISGYKPELNKYQIDALTGINKNKDFTINTKRCIKGHELIWTKFSDGPYSCKTFQCNICGNQCKCEDGRFLCLECVFDMCKPCSEKPKE